MLQNITLTRDRHQQDGRKAWRGLAKPARWCVSIGVGLGAWYLIAAHYGPSLFASPGETVSAAIDLARSGELWASAYASGLRILVGWTIGVLIGVPLGVLMGHIPIVRKFVDPYIQFFRFVPPISLVTLAIVWFGIGELSKVVLIIYTAVFIVVINTIAGVVSVDENQLRAARTLGAGKRQILVSVVLPSIVPYIFTGARLAMGNSFLTIVSAELVAANVGLGALIWQARNYGRIDWIFVGIISLGMMGYAFDRILLLCGHRFMKRYGVKE